MPLIVWDDSWKVGNSAIDFDHMQLVTITNQVYDIIKEGTATKAEMKRLFDQLIAYVERHFAREVAMFSKTKYPQSAAHKAMHRELEKVVRDISVVWMKEPDLLNMDEVAEFLRRWLTDHILKHDMGYREYLSKR